MQYKYISIMHTSLSMSIIGQNNPPKLHYKCLDFIFFTILRSYLAHSWYVQEVSDFGIVLTSSGTQYTWMLW